MDSSRLPSKAPRTTSTRWSSPRAPISTGNALAGRDETSACPTPTRLFSVFVLRQLERLSLRIWDEGNDAAADRLQEIQGTARPPECGAGRGALVRDARWLIQTAQGPLTRRLDPYFKTAERISASFTSPAVSRSTRRARG